MKQMKKIVDKNRSVLEEPNAIMNEVQCFYESLYKSRDVEDCEINELISEIPELSEEQQVSLEGEITLEEAGTALKNMKNGKSPGTDGFGEELKKREKLLEANWRFCC